MLTRAIGDFFSWAREHVARACIRARVSANALTVLGLAFTTGAGWMARLTDRAAVLGPSFTLLRNDGRLPR